MKSKINLVILIISVLFIAFGCSKQNESIETEPYKGKSLHIGVIGDKPKIREEHILARVKSIGVMDYIMT